MNSRVPVAIEWEGDTGLSERAFTRVVGPYGCLVVLPHELAIGQSLRVVNLANDQANAAKVVWKGSHRNEGWELGIELTNPSMDFWGLDL